MKTGLLQLSERERKINQPLFSSAIQDTKSSASREITFSCFAPRCSLIHQEQICFQFFDQLDGFSLTFIKVRQCWIRLGCCRSDFNPLRPIGEPLTNYGRSGCCFKLSEDCSRDNDPTKECSQ